ncbi:MAG: hydrogenase expression/formation protein [Chloroflexi bacterium]|nr:hydrogenase expression/formation protein [Chloroflexota bacterium]
MPESPYLPVGKLNLELMAQLLRFQGWPDDRVVLGPKIGEDAAVIDFGDRYLVAKTDPITFATEEIGWYLVQVNANDLATTGAMPRWLLVTLLLPENKTTPELADHILAQIDAACQELHIALVGGHTEVTYGLDRPIAVGHMLGEVAKNKLISTSGARVGDDLVLVKGIAIEGTSIIAREKSQELQQRGYTPDMIQRAQNYLYHPGISIVREAKIAVESAIIHAMHDPTEGGVATGLHELAEAAQVGVWVDEEAIPIWPESAMLCQAFGLNPLGTIASGALLIALPPQQTPVLLSAYEKAQVICAVIGRVTPAEEGRKLKSGAVVTDLPRFDQDEITKLF